MDLNSFIKDFASQFDDTDISVFGSDTNYRDLEEWSSLNALAVLNMIEKKHNIHIMPQEMRTTNTIRELFDLVQSKK
ncbi:MAG: phosphopantetheine-binding protein [Prevotellaceae bacterium]|jgi:acyl carrier protein|nr:phosphopantetheine-binding protein [Prevotellaceae bacterium]